MKICQIKSKNSYDNFLKYWIPVLNHLIINNKIPKNFNKFIKYIGYEFDETSQCLIETNPDAKKLWAIWERGYINTCSNAIESRHGHLNNSLKSLKTLKTDKKMPT